VRGKYVLIGDPVAKPVISKLPPCLQERCVATPGLIAEVVDNRFVCHLPYYRQAEMFARMGVIIHRKTLSDWALLASDWLAIIYREIQYEHWRALYRQIDETPIRYLEPGSGKAQTGYLWVSNKPNGTVFYHWRKGRDGGGITELFEPTPSDDIDLIDPVLAPLMRIIQCDGYSAYPSWAKGKPWIKLMGCHAHVRRKFFEAKEQSPRLVGWILRQIGHLYRERHSPDQTRGKELVVHRLRRSRAEIRHPLHHCGKLPSPWHQHQGIP